MPIYLFRGRDCDLCFAYSLDVTGRNIPHSQWVYVGMVAPEQLRADPGTLYRLRKDGFYLFKG